MGTRADTSAARALPRAHKRIELRTQHSKIAKQIEIDYQINPVVARVLAARGHSVGNELKNFLQPTLKEGLPAPEELLNLQAACDLIAKAVAEEQGIAICCDFDVDGLSGGSILFHSLRSLGAKVKVFVPDRFLEGYGLNAEMVQAAAAEGFKLLVTVDYGTTNVAELKLAKKLKLKTVVIDHHHVSAIPPADVFINPQQKGCGFADKLLCAAGLAWYVVAGLRRTLSPAKNIDPKNYLDLACLGTVCDMVPLIGVNRVLAKRGLELLGTTKRPGLKALKDVIGINNEVTCTHVGFGIGPRINAAGRMVHGEVVIDLLTTEDSILAAKIARQLNRLNQDRQETESRIKDLATRKLAKLGALPWGLVVWDRDFHTGVIGLVSQRLVEMFHRPAVVIGADDGTYKGSVRGISGFNVVGALAQLSKHLLKFGGHEGAGGFSIAEAEIPSFAKAFDSYCEVNLKLSDLEPYVQADTEVLSSELSLELIDALSELAPFGMGNPNPQLLMRNLNVIEVRVLKDAHLRVKLSSGNSTLTALLWRQNSHPALQVGNTVDVVCRPGLNSFNGFSEIQLTLTAVELTE